MIRAVLFDLDGVLVDSERFYNRRRATYLATQGIDVGPGFDLSGYAEEDIWRTIVPDDPVHRQELREGYLVYQKDHPSPFVELLNPDARELLAALAARGVKRALASSSPRPLIDQFLDETGLRDSFDFAISGEQCPAPKPSPEIYLTAIAELGLTPAECLVVEDSPLGIAAGLAAGAHVVALAQYNDDHRLDQSAAPRVVARLIDVLDLLDD